jgi:hypothetical protein
MSPLLGRNRYVTGATGHTADGFATLFAHKVERVRSDTMGLPPPPVINKATSSLTSFRPCSQKEVRKIVMSSPIKSCSLDPVPTFLLREFVYPNLCGSRRIVLVSYCNNFSHRDASNEPKKSKLKLNDLKSS